jgi:hypothetical protein
MFNKYFLYIGSNNQTNKLEKVKAIEIINQCFDGFTCYEVVGFWQGKQEKTLKVEIVSDINQDTKIAKLCKDLKLALNQDAVMLEKIQSNILFI